MRKNPITISAVAAFLFTLFAVATQAQNTISTLAGGGPNNLPATKSSIGVPWGVVQDGTNTYITDTLTSRVFKIDGSGTLTVLAGNIVSGYTLDGVTDGAAKASLSSRRRSGRRRRERLRSRYCEQRHSCCQPNWNPGYHRRTNGSCKRDQHHRRRWNRVS